MAPVLKTGDLQGSGGSNPSPSASKNLNRTLGLGSFSLFSSAFIIAYNVVKPPISACSRLYWYLVNRIQADGLCRESRLMWERRMVGYLPTANKKPLGAFGLGSLFRLENGKKQGAKRKILQIFFARRLYLRFDTWNYTLFFALSVSRWKYTFRSKTDTFRYWKYTKSEKPSIYGYRRYTLALQLKYSHTGDKGGSPSGSA